MLLKFHVLIKYFVDYLFVVYITKLYFTKNMIIPIYLLLDFKNGLIRSFVDVSYSYFFRINSVLHTVQSYGDYEKLCQGVFENFLSLKHKNSSLTNVRISIIYYNLLYYVININCLFIDYCRFGLVL